MHVKTAGKVLVIIYFPTTRPFLSGLSRRFGRCLLLPPSTSMLPVEGRNSKRYDTGAHAACKSTGLATASRNCRRMPSRSHRRGTPAQRTWPTACVGRLIMAHVRTGMPHWQLCCLSVTNAVPFVQFVSSHRDRTHSRVVPEAYLMADDLTLPPSAPSRCVSLRHARTRHVA